MRVLVTGITGFVGRYFAQICDCVPLIDMGDSVDLRDGGRVRRAISKTDFDAVLHLAAQSNVPESFRDPVATFKVNFEGTYNLLNALRESGFDGPFIYVGSADAYGSVGDHGLPVDESVPLRPRNPYAVSKCAAEALCYQWSQTEDMCIVMARPFNHIGPGQDPRFAVSDFARQITEIRLGRREPVIATGDIDVTRDFTDVRDVVRAYRLLLGSGKNGEIYNVCSGNEYSLRKLITRMCELAGVEVTVKQDPARFRPAEQRRMYGSYARLRGDTGWAPEYALDETLKDVLEYWEEVING